MSLFSLYIPFGYVIYARYIMLIAKHYYLFLSEPKTHKKENNKSQLNSHSWTKNKIIPNIPQS